jgi:superfamily II DNA or RNA helicase
VLRVGQRVRIRPENREAEVYRFEDRGGRHVVGLIFADTREAREFLFTPGELTERLELLPSLAESFRRPDRLLPREQCLAFAEALRMRLAYTFDPHYGVSVTQVDLLPHQVEAVYRYILPQPHIRFLLADDPGLGKTIMAGLVLKELKARGLLRRTLILVPAHLVDQWQRELGEWFREGFTVLNRGLLHSLFAPDFFERNPQVLVSMDFARQDEVRDLLCRVYWDLVIVDEAHKLSATRYGRKVYKTKRYQLGEALATRCNHLLFLTATPHKGDDEAYFLLLDLLQPRLFARAEHLKESARAQGLPFVLRRSKEQVTDLAGNRLFKRREVRTLGVTLTGAEQRLYDAVTAYVRRWYGTVSGRTDRRSRNVALALTVLQRRLSSSLFAVRESLRRRREKLRRLLQEWERRLEEEEALPVLDEEAWEDLAEQTAREWESLQERLEGITAARTPEELREELEEIEELIGLAQQAERAGEEAKVGELRRVVEERLRHHPEEKLIIFTEFKDTLLALRRKIEQWGFPVAVIHGELSLQERIEQERRFRDQVQVLVGTDAAGEGLNLQFARLMVNFDLPWNPNRLEQRMGRIHRYGQRRDCFVFNMLYPQTREGSVLERLLQKLERMRERLGDSVYDVIGELMEGVRLEDLIMEAILRGDTNRVEQVIEVDLERRFEEYRRALEENALAQHHIDLGAVLTGERGSLQKRLVPWDVERFTRHVVPLVGGACEPEARRPGVFRLSVPRTFLRQHQLPSDSFAQGVRVAFERPIAREAGVEFFAPGHPVLEALTDHFLQKSRPVLGIFAHPRGEEGVLWLFRATVRDGEGQPALERLVALFWNARTGSWQEVDPRMLWDLEPWPDASSAPDHLLRALEAQEAAARQSVMDSVEGLKREAAERRERECRIKEQWLRRCYDYLIRESNAKLFEYHRRAEKGEEMRVAIQQEEENLKRLTREQVERLEALQRQRTLTLLEPQLEAVFLVGAGPVPAGEAANPEARRRIEQIGMGVAMGYEREQGREPVDVSGQFLGYDIRSEGPGEVRYIEVKALAAAGPIELTPHEWQMAQRLQEAYWLYVVENALAGPRLHTIQNPAKHLKAEPVVGVVKVVIADWGQGGRP